MNATTHNTATSLSEQLTDTAQRPTSKLVSAWAQGRRNYTPWAYPRLRAFAAVRFAAGIFVVVVGAVMLSLGYDGLAAVPLAGAVVLFTIASLDLSAARSAAPRS
jgi:hypothetical protein